MGRASDRDREGRKKKTAPENMGMVSMQDLQSSSVLHVFASFLLHLYLSTWFFFQWQLGSHYIDFLFFSLKKKSRKIRY